MKIQRFDFTNVGMTVTGEAGRRACDAQMGDAFYARNAPLPVAPLSSFSAPIANDLPMTNLLSSDRHPFFRESGSQPDQNDVSAVSSSDDGISCRNQDLLSFRAQIAVAVPTGRAMRKMFHKRFALLTCLQGNSCSQASRPPQRFGIHERTILMVDRNSRNSPRA